MKKNKDLGPKHRLTVDLPVSLYEPFRQKLTEQAMTAASWIRVQIRHFIEIPGDGLVNSSIPPDIISDLELLSEFLAEEPSDSSLLLSYLRQLINQEMARIPPLRFSCRKERNKLIQQNITTDIIDRIISGQELVAEDFPDIFLICGYFSYTHRQMSWLIQDHQNFAIASASTKIEQKENTEYEPDKGTVNGNLEGSGDLSE
ncbi:hypothetical protein V6O07_00670 [Arthrospira platensis SPKY2]